VTSNTAEADIILVGPKTDKASNNIDKGKGKGKASERNVYQWDEFVCFLRENRSSE
jgi:hypothetical protein